MRARFELLGLFVAGATLILARGEALLLLPFGLGLGGIWVYLGAAVSRCSGRLAAIEARVNALVRAGEDPGPADPLPMQWESMLQGSWFNRSRWHRGTGQRR